VIGLRERSHVPELMDSERVDLAAFEGCLRDLARTNRWTGAYRITLDWLEGLRRAHGCGGSFWSTSGRGTAT
jgi:hypothetical protein